MSALPPDFGEFDEWVETFADRRTLDRYFGQFGWREGDADFEWQTQVNDFVNMARHHEVFSFSHAGWTWKDFYDENRSWLEALPDFAGNASPAGAEILSAPTSTKP